MISPVIYGPSDIERIITPDIHDALKSIADELEETDLSVADFFAEFARAHLATSTGGALLNASHYLELFDFSDGYGELLNTPRAATSFIRGGLCLGEAIVSTDRDLYSLLNSQLAKRLKKVERQTAPSAIDQRSRGENYDLLVAGIEASSATVVIAGMQDVLERISDEALLEEPYSGYMKIGAGWVMHEAVACQVRLEAKLGEQQLVEA